MSYEKLDQCPVCHKDQFSNQLITTDQLVSKESFVVVACNSCGFLFTNPRPAQDHIGKYYQSKDYISHNDRAGSLLNLVYKTARYFTLSSKTKLLQKYQVKGSVLDIGCGTGDFLLACRRAGWDITGMEPDSTAREIAVNRTGIDIHANLEDIQVNSGFDCITLWHVLEHIHDLDGALQVIRSALKRTGTLFVAVPNHRSEDARHYAEHWAGWDVPRHLYHFDEDSMEVLLKRHKLKLKKVLPMKLDSYYVSLLSEAYLGTGLISKYLRAIKNGRRSNKLARKNNNYSSLIYIISY